MDFIQPYLDYFSQNPEWAVAVIFLIAFGEALLIIGLFVPSTAVLIGAGMLVGTGHLEFGPVFAATTIGAIAGDQISYWAGRLFGSRLKLIWPLKHYPQLVARGEDFVKSHGGKSIAIGRFVPGVKAVVPGVVGMFGMGQFRFAAINFSSGFVWAAAHVFPGMLLGQGLALAGELSGRLVVVLLVLFAILAIAGYLIRLLAAGLSYHLSYLLGEIAAWAKNRRSPSLRRFGRAIAPENPRSLMIVLFTAVFVTGVILLINITFGLATRDAVSNADLSVYNLLKEVRNAPADELMIIITLLGDFVVLLAMMMAAVLWLIWRKAYRAALAALVTFVAGRLSIAVLKAMVHRARPPELNNAIESFAFPSGHAAMTALAFGVVAVLASHSMGRWGRAVVYATSGIAVVAVAFSRIYLGVHWLSDVIGGLLFGAVMAAAFAVAIEAIPPRRIRPLGLFGATLIAFVGTGAVHVNWNYAAAEVIYAQRSQLMRVEETLWQAGDWRRLPAKRIDLAGKPEEVFLVQWAGDITPLGDVLAASGWYEWPGWTWQDILPYLDPAAELSELAPRPALHEGLKAIATYVKPIPDTPNQRQVLRVFRTSMMVISEDGTDQRSIYLLSLMRERLRRGFNLYAVPGALASREPESEALLAALAADPRLHIVAQNPVEGANQALVLASP